MADTKKDGDKKSYISRRKFLLGGGAVIAAGALAACSPKTITNTVTETTTKTTTAPPVTKEAITSTVATTVTAPGTTITTTAAGTKITYAASTGYLLVDHIKCAGCMTCMMACSLAHEGQACPSLSRIQIEQSSFLIFPNDVRQYQCRQCATPVCVENCPVGAAYVDTANGNVRRIDQTKCIGCGTCIKMCPQQPHRTVWNSTISKSSKCDLCIDAPYLGAKGGPGGTQACVAVCPMQAIKFTSTMPDQTGDIGYDVNLRNANAVKINISEVPVKV